MSWNKCAKMCCRRKQDEAIASSCLILATPLVIALRLLIFMCPRFCVGGYRQSFKRSPRL